MENGLQRPLNERYGLFSSTILLPTDLRAGDHMKIRCPIRGPVSALLLLTLSQAQAASDLGQQMEALHVHTALVIHSQEMDDLPMWSPDARFLAVDLAGKWLKVDISSLQLQR